MVRAKKSLGQNFLTSRKIAGDIVRAAGINEGDPTSLKLRRASTVLEIGPGRGMLTAELLLAGADVVAIEKDAELIPILKEKFAEEIKSKQLKLIEGDALTVRNPVTNSYKLVANIPYYITGEIIRSFLTSEYQPTSMTLLVQKEVAERVVAKNGKESILSLSVKAYGEPKFVAKVPAKFFNPKPKVDSAILHIKNISRKFFEQRGPTSHCGARNDLSCIRQDGFTEERFFQIVKAGFAQKRKKLVNNLASLVSKEEVLKIFKDLDIEENTRAEDIPLQTWKEIAKILAFFS